MGNDLKRNLFAVLGANGMLGSEFVRQLESASLPCVRGAYGDFDRRNYAEVDITNPHSLEFFVREFSPSVIINCGAYTAVDLAENNYDDAFLVNAMGVKNLAEVCRTNGIRLVHLSTDYVFGGVKGLSTEREPFVETSKCSPCGVYGYSKYFGEEFVRSILSSDSLIVRTSWLHGQGGPNFVDTIANLVMEKSELKIVNDQIGSLTWTSWLASTIVKLIDKDVRGIIHASGSNQASWYDIAHKIAEILNPECRILSQTTEELNRPAPRPRYSKLANENLARVLGEKVPTWEEFLDSHLRQVGLIN